MNPTAAVSAPISPQQPDNVIITSGQDVQRTEILTISPSGTALAIISRILLTNVHCNSPGSSLWFLQGSFVDMHLDPHGYQL
jgi:hypothetical protein